MVSLAPPSRLATFIALAVADVHPIGHMIVTQQRIILGGITTTVASTVTKTSPMNLLGSPKQTFFVGTHQSRNLVEVGQNGNATMQLLLQNPKTLSAALEVKSRPWQMDFDLILEKTAPYLHLMFQAAARAAKAPMVEFLLAFGNQHDLPPTKLITPDSINHAIMSMEVDVLKKMFAVMPELVSCNLGHGITLLGNTIAKGINLGLSKKSNLQPKNNAFLPIIAFLLENGVDPNKSSNPYSCPIQDAAGQSSVEIVKVLLQHGATIPKSWACHAAAKFGRIDVLEVLLEHGADIGEKFEPQPHGYFKDNETPLHVAIRCK
ncbi:hypothetical protein B0J14DRAFT_642926 [Halenospora varia]|nr:hypothetical protein B0J14DRAFT_642926 [Halenospora varia]